MKTFHLKKYSDNEIVVNGIQDLEELHQAIINNESFILAYDGIAKVVVGSHLKNELSLGNITLKAEYSL